MKQVNDSLTKMLKNLEELEAIIKLRQRTDLISMRDKLFVIVADKIWKEHLVPFAEGVADLTISDDDVIARARAMIEVYDGTEKD